MKTLTKMVASALLFTACVPAMAANMVCSPKKMVDENMKSRGYVKTTEMTMSVLGNDGTFIAGRGEFWISPEAQTIIAFVRDGQSCLVAVVADAETIGI